MSVEKRLTDARINFNKLRLIAGLVSIALGTLVGFLNYFLSTVISIVIAVFFAILGSYLLATCQSLSKDIALKIEDSINIETKLNEPKISKK